MPLASVAYQPHYPFADFSSENITMFARTRRHHVVETPIVVTGMATSNDMVKCSRVSGSAG